LAWRAPASSPGCKGRRAPGKWHHVRRTRAGHFFSAPGWRKMPLSPRAATTSGRKNSRLVRTRVECRAPALSGRAASRKSDDSPRNAGQDRTRAAKADQAIVRSRRVQGHSMRDTLILNSFMGSSGTSARSQARACCDGIERASRASVDHSGTNNFLTVMPR